MPSPVAELLARLGAGLGELGVRWYLFGAQAVILHGAPRLTADVDVTVELHDRPTADLVAALAGRRIALRVADRDRFVEETRVLPMVDEPSRIPVDIVLAGPGPEELFLARARTLVVEGVPVRLAAAEDVVAMKVLAGRPRDLEDVVAVVRAQGARFDVALARATVGLLERALDQADLTPLLEAALARAGRGKEP